MGLAFWWENIVVGVKAKLVEQINPTIQWLKQVEVFLFIDFFLRNRGKWFSPARAS